VLYKGIIADPSHIGYVAEYRNRLAGFIVGSDQPAGLYRRLLQKRLFQFAFASLNAFIKKPKILPRLLRSIKLVSHQDDKLPFCALLMSIAVDINCQGKGTGSILVSTFIKEASRRKCQYVRLTTDAENNDYVNHFYQSKGFKLYREYITSESRKMNEYMRSLNH